MAAIAIDQPRGREWDSRQPVLFVAQLPDPGPRVTNNSTFGLDRLPARRAEYLDASH